MGRENLQRLDADRCHELALDRSADAHIRALVRTKNRLADEGIRAPVLRFMEAVNIQYNEPITLASPRLVCV